MWLFNPKRSSLYNEMKHSNPSKANPDLGLLGTPLWILYIGNNPVVFVSCKYSSTDKSNWLRFCFVFLYRFSQILFHALQIASSKSLVNVHRGWKSWSCRWIRYLLILFNGFSWWNIVDGFSDFFRPWFPCLKWSV